jgi:signal transduction histidine kinase/DNA-binding response OmpR family regulator
MPNNNKREISCKAILTLLKAAQKKNINTSEILDGVPYELPFLFNKQQRIEWWVVCRIVSNLKPYFTISEYEQMGRDFVADESYIEGVIFWLMIYSSGKLSNILRNQLMKASSLIVKPLFPCIKQQTDYIAKNKVRLHFTLNPGYQNCPELFYMSTGVLQGLGTKTSKKGLKVELKIIPNGGIYYVSWDDAGFLFNVRKWMLWLFNMRKAFADLTESHDELLNQFNKLEETRKLLQNQTTQLRTAHNITTSIRQSLNINKTLKAITNALVKEANFDYAYIRLFKDIEGFDLNIEDYSGANKKDARSVNMPVIINENKIGELIISPNYDTEVSEYDELLNYLMPIINIAIHDSLILRTVTDYKDNLEFKVDKRTAELKEAQHKLAEIIKAQNRFFTNISHEFRTPLTLIMGPSRQILEGSSDDKVKEHAELINRNAKKLNLLANQLLDISRIEAGRMKLKTGQKNIVPVIKRITYSFQSFAESKDISLDFHSEKEKIILYADEDKIDKIFSNLLSNALKFTPAGGRIIVRVITDENFVEISISDNGIGIPKDKIDKIFDRFYQVDNKLSKEYGGTGIGLSLTKELVEIHKGKISVESEVGKGSTFKVILPLRKEHLLPEEIDEDISMTGEDEKDITPQSFIASGFDRNLKTNDRIASVDKLDKPQLLIIEDHPDVRKYISDILCSSYNIDEAFDGEDGLRKSFEEIPDMIISDIMMPKMDGIKLCQSLKSDSRTSHIPIILLTAKATINDKIEGLQTGADDYIMKPFEEAELKARINNLLEQRERIHKHFQKYEVIIEEEKITSLDQRFLKQTLSLINEHISDNNFSVEELAQSLAVSRSLLHKKLVILLGEAPREVIKRIRLNKAAKLIKQKSGNISEIALEVGFNNPSYFAECFQKQFGFNPSQYHHNSIENQ